MENNRVFKAYNELLEELYKLCLEQGREDIYQDTINLLNQIEQGKYDEKLQVVADILAKMRAMIEAEKNSKRTKKIFIRVSLAVILGLIGYTGYKYYSNKRASERRLNEGIPGVGYIEIDSPITYSSNDSSNVSAPTTTYVEV